MLPYVKYELDAVAGLEEPLTSEVALGTDEPVELSLSGSDMVSRTLTWHVSCFADPFTVLCLLEEIAGCPCPIFLPKLFLRLFFLRLKRVDVNF